jgi:hypothetical protein
MEIQIPSRLCFINFPDFCVEIDKYALEEDLNLSFADLEFARPMGSLLFGKKIKEIVRSRKSIGLKTTWNGEVLGTGAQSYLRHIGFFNYIGIPKGNMVGEANGSSSYLPITSVSLDELDKQNSNDGILEKVQLQSYKICSLLGIEANPYSPNACAYSFREIMRNVFEHANTDSLHYTVQKYWGNEVEIGIIDEGIGIKEAMKKRYPEITTDLDAILKAIKPGISAADIFGENVNGNSGYGLFVLSRLGILCGQFIIASGDAAIIVEKGKVPIKANVKIDGTFVGIKFDNLSFDFDQVLNKIVSKGEKYAKGSGDNPIASGSSKKS